MLDISQTEALEAVGMNRWSEEYHRMNRRSETEFVPPVDLDKLWHYLQSTYGGNSGIERAQRQNATFIIKELNLDGIRR